MNTKDLVEDLAQTSATLQAQALGVVVDYPIEGHPRVARLLIAREADGLFTVVIASPEGNAVRPQDFEAEATDLLKAAFPTAVGHLPLEGSAALLHGYREEASTFTQDAAFQAALEKLQGEGAIDWAPGISEPGYECGPKGVLLANWNPIDEALQEWLKDQGYTLHWADEWTTCDDCQRIYRTVSDCYFWQLYGWTDTEGQDHCGSCVLADPTDYLTAREGDDAKAVTLFKLDPATHGYLKVNPEGFESGFHLGQDADPRAMAATLKAQGVTRFLFKLVATSQFYVTFDLYLHEDHASALEGIRSLLGRRP